VRMCFSVFMLSCVQVEALRLADHSSKESYRLRIDQETEKRPDPTRVTGPLKIIEPARIIHYLISENAEFLKMLTEFRS
jgi:hypothetical protein